MKNFEHRSALRFAAWLFLIPALLLQAQIDDPYGIKPKNHAQNKKLVADQYAAALQAHAAEPHILVLPGLIADRMKKRVEISVERSALERNAPCEFMVVSELSDHTYETLFISFAKPSDVHRALEFLGAKGGQSFDPGSLRYWPKGESFVIRLARSGKPSVPIASLLLDKRTGNPLPEQRFMFTGSRRVTIRDGQSSVYAADAVQPMSIVSLFNAADSVLQVPHQASKNVIYQNTVIHPETLLDDGLLTLTVEPAGAEDRVKEFEWEVSMTRGTVSADLSDTDRMKALRVQVHEPGAAPTEKLSLPALLEQLSHLDRQQRDFFLTVRFSDDLDLGHARTMAGVLALIDSDRGVRIEPPPAGQLYYRAFMGDRNLLDRKTRILHPMELILSERDGNLSGKLACVTLVPKQGSATSELESIEVPVANPSELIREVETDKQRLRARDQAARPPVLMVFVSPSMTYGKLMKFLAPLLPTHKMIHLYFDSPQASP
jgi:hypothetical protein